MNKKLKVALVGILLVVIGAFLSIPKIVSFGGTLLSGYNASYGVFNAILTVVGITLVISGIFLISAGLKKLTFVLASIIVFVVIFSVGTIFSFLSIEAVSDDVETAEIQIDATDPNAIPVEIPMGSDTKAIANILKDGGLITNPQVFKIVSKLNGFDGKYQAGTHILKKDLELNDIMKVLISKPESVKITIPEGLTYKQIVKKFEDKGIAIEDKFDYAMKYEKYDFDFIKQITNTNNREFILEGYLFPDTYEFAMNPGEKVIINVMLRNFDSKLTKEHYKRAQELGMSMDQIITLASIIEREANSSADRRLVSAVFHKRLKSKEEYLRKLQSCATLQYIFLNREGKVHDQITYEDTTVDDAYNTYLHPGLPPGPICSPGMDSINAALYPDEDTDYMFFIATGDGTTKFTKSYNEHLKAMKQYGLTK
ncbi:endolytic transglycosylase MltG [Ruminiclostridium herbifermentans]|uniref:Endolytic murein transglycosylase n=1 Tax=Ruminiclostridium herbifermentans TaxID=2488810 RepID=A0A4U7JBJ6_9FIRM|nr:endolytic transglycosylase MltG [Ruminiclostridium herbifermentans]QNU65834.1 endolytic transglycosylase MltG [Ruminiclostridium herbifermentans]